MSRRALVLGGIAVAAFAAVAAPGGAATRPPEPVPLALPDTLLHDEHGEPVRFATDVVGDRIVAIQLIFTSCTTVCPPLGATFGKLRGLLGSRAGAEVGLVSITVDPHTDTPARLLAWARPLGHGPGWTLLTGQRQSLAAVLAALGLATPDALAHSTVVWIGHRASGRWTRTNGLASAATLLAAIDELAREVEAARAARGERIYRSGIGASGAPIAASMPAGAALGSTEPGGELPAAVVACANCHGPDRRGRTEGGVAAADLTWALLSDPDGRRRASGGFLPPYTPELLARAVARGVDSAGQPLAAAMPRYRLSAADLADLLAFLRTAAPRQLSVAGQ